MADVFASFAKTKKFLVCVDSDGCAMDTMDIKHFQCFGPCMVDEWQLGEWGDTVLRRWNEINLYSMTRGVNRFKGLALLLDEVNRDIAPIAQVEALVRWVDSTKELSNGALQGAVQQTGNTCLTKALHWSRAVNAAIERLPDEAKQPFAGAAAGLKAAHRVADVAVVSSANRDAVLAEWQEHGLLEHVDIVLAQDCGSKAHCIAQLLAAGYLPENVLMVGDAPGDCDAAKKNGVHFFPILVRREQESWQQLEAEALPLLTGGAYAALGAQKQAEFYANLQGNGAIG